MTARIRALLDGAHDAPLVVPGVGTPLEAQLAAQAGFECLYLSGYSTAAWRHGVPDIGLVALGEISDALAAVTDAVSLPVLCDADTGYGDLAGVLRTVRVLEQRGAAAIQLEDQAWPKRCGHLRGKQVVSADEHARKIAAAVSARRDADTLIVARTDALAQHGVDEAISRGRRYAEAGADVLFVDAPTSEEELAAIGEALRDVPLIANMSESGRTPQLPAARFHQLGFEVVIYPTTALRVAAAAMSACFTELRERGDSSGWLSRMASLDELNAAVGLLDVEQRTAPFLPDEGTTHDA